MREQGTCASSLEVNLRSLARSCFIVFFTVKDSKQIPDYSRPERQITKVKDYTISRRTSFNTVVEGNRNRQDLEVAALAVGTRSEVADNIAEGAHCSHTAAAAAGQQIDLEEHQSLLTQSLRLFTFQ